MTLFAEGEFEARSGVLPWKVECDALTDADWKWAAARVAERFWIRDIHGVPTGGMKFANALKEHRDQNGEYLLIVDDVLTTGASMEAARRNSARVLIGVPRVGIVMFARVRPAAWVEPIWQLWGPP